MPHRGRPPIPKSHGFLRFLRQIGYIAPMQALEALYNLTIHCGPFVLVGWAAKRYLDGWAAANLGKRSSEVQDPAGSDRHQRRFLLGAWYK